MIANITQGQFLKGLLLYNDKKIEEQQANVFMLNNIVSDNIKVIQVTLNSVMELNPNVKDKVFHISLNFKNQDFNKLDDKQQKNIIADYMQNLGFDKTHPYAVYFHKDKAHPHFHIVTSKILQDGTKLNDSHIFRKSQRVSRALELKYNLTPVPSKKENTTNKYDIDSYQKALNLLDFNQINFKAGNLDFKSYLLNNLNFILKFEKPKSFSEFEKLLSLNNIKVEYTNHKKHKGIIFKFGEDAKGISASKLDKSFIFPKLKDLFKKNKKEYKAVSIQVANKIDFILYKYKQITPETFRKELEKFDIKVTPNITNNVIRGFSFEYKNFIFKGQDLPQRKYTIGKIGHKFVMNDDSKLSDIYYIKSRFNNHKHLYDFTNLGEFINGIIKDNLRPIIINNDLVLTKIENKDIELDKTNSFIVPEFKDYFINHSETQKFELNDLINKLIEKHQLETPIDKIKNETKELENNNIDNLYYDLTYNISDDADDNNNQRKKQKKRRKRRL